MTSSDVLEKARPMFFREQEGEWETAGSVVVFFNEEADIIHLPNLRFYGSVAY